MTHIPGREGEAEEEVVGGRKGKALVRDYMTKAVVSMSPDVTISDAIPLIVQQGHVGLPVADGRKLIGFVTPKEILRNVAHLDKRVRDIIAPGTVVAHPDMDLADAARILFRVGVKELPVVDDEGFLVGIISTTDIIRSHIERVTPTKLEKLKETLESLYNITIRINRRVVEINGFLPTQKRIFADELEGRMRELKRGLAEPILLIWKKPQPILVDGHHRVVAAQRLGIKRLDAFILEFDEDIELGLERNARSSGLNSMADVEINDFGQHPLVEITTRFLKDEKENR
ncbi:MAG: CBS domain-containing protein [Euryarchaeota archaeon]|nr:CBS domain-containing protein [Euryarchaeota archaeon]